MVCMVEEVEKVSLEPQVFRLGQRKPLPNRKIKVALGWPAQHVPSNVADVRSSISRQGRRIMRAGYGLSGLDRGRYESCRIEIIP